jgi:membrane-bound serine protease (ClpP class)
MASLVMGSVLLLAQEAERSAPSPGRPRVVRVDLNRMLHHVSAGHVTQAIEHANATGADAVLIVLDTPGGLQNSMRQLIQAIFDSRVPVITYVAPSGGGAASAGFFILLAGDAAAMAPGTTTGAAHPVMIGGVETGKTMEEKIASDAAAYIRSIADKRGRDPKLAEEAVRSSRSFTEKEALEGKLIDVIASTPEQVLAQLDGKEVRRIDDSTTRLRLADAVIEKFEMGRREQFFAWIADPNIAFLLGAIGLALLYIEFTNPGLIAPGVVGAIALVMAMYAFNLLPINTLGILLILLAVALFILEATITSHGLLGAAGAVAMIIGAMILVDSPWPEARIRLSTALAVTLPLSLITIILLRYAVAAYRAKATMGPEALVETFGTAQTDLTPEGKVLVRGEIWNARARTPVAQGDRVRVVAAEGLTLLVEKPDNPG